MCQYVDTGSFVGYDGVMKSNEIKAEIVRAGVTQREIAKIIGIRHESLSRILRDEVSDSDVARIRDAIEKASAAGAARLALGDP